MQLLVDKVRQIEYVDPYVPEIDIDGKRFIARALTKQILSAADCVVILTDHSCFDYDFILQHSRLILDTRNAITRRNIKKLYTLGVRRR